MKAPKIVLIILYLLFFKFSISQPYVYEFPGLLSPGISPGEVVINNQTKYAFDSLGLSAPFRFVVRIYPKGAFYNGFKIYTPHGISRRSVDESFDICGGDAELNYYGDPGGTYTIKINFDDGPPGRIVGTQCKFNIGFGLYVVEFWHSSSNGEIDFGQPMINSFEIDWRNANFRGYAYTGNGGSILDIRIDFFKPDLITFKHFANDPIYFQDIRNVNKFIRMWDLYGVSDTIDRIPYSKGLFFNDSNFASYPISGKDYYMAGHFLNPSIHENYGDFGLNLVITHNVITRDTLVDTITNILIPMNGALKISPGNVFEMITPIVPSIGSNNLIIQDSATLVIGSNSELIVRAQNKLTLKNKGQITFYPNSGITFMQGSSFCNLGGKVCGPGNFTYNSGSHILCREIVDNLYSDSVKIILEDSATLEIPDSTTLHFTGSQSGLIMKPNSKLKMGVGSKILFDYSAKLIAEGATFTSIDSTKTWEGIILQNSQYDTIRNCTFKNAKTAVSIINSNSFSYLRRIIQNNIFNVPSGGNYKGIYGENNYRILIKDNTFNMPVASGSYIYSGLYLKNNSTSGVGATEEPEPLYTMNIIHNTFNNGSASIILANYISSISSYYIANNTFNNASVINLLGMKINGRIKNNNFTSSSVPMAIHLISSYPDLFNNSITARDVSLHLAGHCYPNLAPDFYGDDLYWYGGMNTLSTVEIDNIQLSSSGYAYSDAGKNTFITENSSAFHIYGLVDSSIANYRARYNCWSPDNIAKIYLKKYYDTLAIASIWDTEGYGCESITPTGILEDFMGSEFSDSVIISEDFTNTELNDDDILYAQGKHLMNPGTYNDAITTFKYLIDNYTDFNGIESAAEYLYGSYQGLDTTSDTSYRNTLYGNLKMYLEEKLESEDFSGDFADVALDIILACESTIKNYNEALNGYEFISLFHPDPNIRLIASWDYEEVEELINSGSGQSMSNYKLQISNNESEEVNELKENKYHKSFIAVPFMERNEELRELKELQRLEEIIKDDPIMSNMKKSYEKSSAERKERIVKEILSESKTPELARQNIVKSSRLDNQKEDRAKRNIFESGMRNKSEKEKRRMEDLILTTKSIRNEMGKNEIVSVPLEYKLEQNYPNPFNPLTTIKFSIPKPSFVTIKIFDILGKEVMTLINETRLSGNYEVEFNGSNLSSGVYFYRLESGNFRAVKRMMLLK